MSNDVPPKKPSLFRSLKRKLVDELGAASDKWTVGEDGSNADKLREEKLKVLNKYDEGTGSFGEIFSQLGVELKATQEFSKRAPYRLNELLVSTDSWPFEELSQLDEHFGALAPGYSYRYLAPSSSVVPESVANNASNVIRLPSAMDLLVDDELKLAGDEIPDATLMDWLGRRSAAMNRLWTLRILSQLGILKGSEVPDDVPETAGGPRKAVAKSAPPTTELTDAQIRELVEDFVTSAKWQYDCESKQSGETPSWVWDKKARVRKLNEGGAIMALEPLLHHKEVSVRVSAATYLLPSSWALAFPVLRAALANCPGNERKRHSISACRHARWTSWMYLDGNLSFEDD